MSDIDSRIDSLELRMAAIEKQLYVGVRPQIIESKPVPVRTQVVYASPDLSSINATQLMAWCASITFVFASLYFLKLVYDTGWLTPARQVGLAYLASMSLVAFGFLFQKKADIYSAYLPAVGLVVLYLTTFVAHLVYGLFSPLIALTMVCVITLFGIWLGRYYQKTVYLIFSAVGVYLSPLLVQAEQRQLIDLVLYYSAWSLLFSFCAVQENRRFTYVLPMYLAILGFDAVFRMTGSNEWVIAVIYQFIQFLIFSLTTITFSVKNKSLLKQDEVFPHGIALLLFYALEYARLQEHLPHLVDYFALLSAVMVYSFYVIAKHYYNESNYFKSGAVLVSWYCSWVVLQAGFFGVISYSWLPWAALITPLIYFNFKLLKPVESDILIPIHLVCVIVFISGYCMLLGINLFQVPFSTPQPTLALCVYAVLLYAVYWCFQAVSFVSPISLYAGHLAFMGVLASWVNYNIYLSALWVLYGVVLLLVATKFTDTVIGKSALLLFAVAAFKVLFFDLSGSNSMSRVFVLIVVSIALYVGGWLYQTLSKK
ncbi:MAG: hypothetical protein RI956_273 [Pseudomonadota bacterium]|jgi:uncharacterized membrane protein